MDLRFAVVILWSGIALVLIFRPEWLAALRGESSEVLQSHPVRGWISYGSQARLVGVILLMMAAIVAVGLAGAARLW